MAAQQAAALSEFRKITAGGPAANDNFGYSVGLSGNTAILGAWKDDHPGMQGADAGSAYIFRNQSGVWSQIDKLVPADSSSGDSFGSSVAISGSTAVVGAILRDQQGGAYIFKDDGAGNWNEVDMLVPDDAAPGDEVGYSVAVSGNTAVVGAWKHNLSTGAAYVFRDDGTGNWSQVGKLTASDGMSNNRFGVSVAISGNTAMVGSHFHTSTAGPLTGAVYVFEDSGGSWSQVGKLTASDASLSNQFGASVAMQGNRAIIGATGDATNGIFAGAAYVFERTGATWQQIDKLTASDAEANDLFGYSVALDTEWAMAGAYQNDDAGITSGSAYFFRHNGRGQWHQIAKLVASDDEAGDALGYSVAISGAVGLAGAPLSNSPATDSGSAYFFQASTAIPGDFNRNGRMDAADYVVWREQLNQAGASLAGDGNGDGFVNQADYLTWRANFGLSNPTRPASGAALPVPEPSSATLLLLGSFVSIHVRLKYSRHGIQ